MYSALRRTPPLHRSHFAWDRLMPHEASFEQRYERVKLLGEGAFGAAYLVQSRRSEREPLCVAKEIRIAHLTENQRESALAESEVLKRMSHSNIVAYVNSFVEGPRLFIVMEYADGGDLAEKIRDHKDANTAFQESEIMFVLLQLALALRHVHDQKILHRDLKPLNIFLTRQGVVKLGDFGIAKVLESTTAGAQTTIGTPLYLSPEVCNNEAYGVKSDLWSLGVVAYELAALKVPFQATSLPALAVKVCSTQPAPLPKQYTSDFGQIVFGLLDKDSRKRLSLQGILRTPYAWHYMRSLYSHSVGTGTGGCEALTIRPTTGNGSSDALSPPSFQQDAVLSEFHRNRQAALENRRRAESGGAAAALGGRPAHAAHAAQLAATPPPTDAWGQAPPRRRDGREEERRPSLEDSDEDGARRVAEVRKRSQHEREERERSRREELDRAMLQARQDRQVARQRLIAERQGSEAQAASQPEAQQRTDPADSMNRLPAWVEEVHRRTQDSEESTLLVPLAASAAAEDSTQFMPPTRVAPLTPPPGGFEGSLELTRALPQSGEGSRDTESAPGGTLDVLQLQEVLAAALAEPAQGPPLDPADPSFGAATYDSLAYSEFTATSASGFEGTEMPLANNSAFLPILEETETSISAVSPAKKGETLESQVEPPPAPPPALVKAPEAWSISFRDVPEAQQVPTTVDASSAPDPASAEVAALAASDSAGTALPPSPPAWEALATPPAFTAGTGPHAPLAVVKPLQMPEPHLQAAAAKPESKPKSARSAAAAAAAAVAGAECKVVKTPTAERKEEPPAEEEIETPPSGASHKKCCTIM